MQGSGENGGWVKELKVTYSLDGSEWNAYSNLLDSDNSEVGLFNNVLFIQNNIQVKRLHAEHRLIFKLGTMQPRGINNRFSVFSF